LETGFFGLDLVFTWLKIAVLRTAETAQWVKEGLMKSTRSFHNLMFLGPRIMILTLRQLPT